MNSRLYTGHVMHRRLAPFGHRLSYRVFSLYADLDELPALHQNLRFFSYNKKNIFSFFDKDHGPRDGSSLRAWIEKHCQNIGLDLQGEKIYLLCLPRIFNYVFNPISVYFCYKQGKLAAILYQVRNTFKEMHSYLLPVGDDQIKGKAILQSCQKLFYVSPFIPMDCHYRFRITPPGDDFSFLIRQSQGDKEVLIATHVARAEMLNDQNLVKKLFTHPLLTLKVIAGIHWDALKLWVKGARYYKRPAPPPVEVTYGK
ncbi:MAG: DUF1365 domain-containing protein [Dongiaceae bacterium]